MAKTREKATNEILYYVQPKAMILTAFFGCCEERKARLRGP